MKIVMTGATGLVGNALGKRLVQEGHQVVTLVRNKQTAGQHLSYPCAVYSWASEVDPAPAKALEGADAIFHLAGENIAAKKWTPVRKKQLVESRVQTLRNLKLGLSHLQVCPQVLISASGVGFYGDRGAEELTETATPGDDFLAKLCVDWEAAADDLNLKRTVKARFGVVISAQGGFLRQVAPLFSALGGSRLGTGRQWFSWIHIDDLVAGLIFALNHAEIRGPVNMVAPNLITNSQLTEGMRQALHTFAAPAVPGVALRLLYGELAAALLGSQRAIPEVLNATGFKWHYPDIKSALGTIYHDLQPGELPLVFESWVPAKMDQVWPLFCSAENLERLTPPFLNFHVLGKSTPEIQEGTVIHYQLKLRGVPMNWSSKISKWQEKKCFVDEQLKGPYTKWHHLHEFSTFAGGTLIRDTVHFKVPLGWLGRLASMQMVLKEIETIFAYRGEVIGQIFSQS